MRTVLSSSFTTGCLSSGATNWASIAATRGPEEGPKDAMVTSNLIGKKKKWSKCQATGKVRQLRKVRRLSKEAFSEIKKRAHVIPCRKPTKIYTNMIEFGLNGILIWVPLKKFSFRKNTFPWLLNVRHDSPNTRASCKGWYIMYCIQWSEPGSILNRKKKGNVGQMRIRWQCRLEIRRKLTGMYRCSSYD